MKKSILRILVTSVAILSVSCVPMQPKSTVMDKFKYQDQQHFESANKKAVEVENTLKKIFLGHDLYSTSERHCDVRALAAVDHKFAKAKADLDSKLDTSEARMKYLNEQVRKTKDDIAQEYATQKINTFAKTKIEDVRVFINYIYMRDDNKSYDFKVGDLLNFEWDGHADVYLIASQGKGKFAIYKNFFDLKSVMSQSAANILYDSKSAKTETFNCLASVNLLNKYKLSNKDKEAIKKNSYYIGMSANAFILSKGSPQTVNNTTTSHGSSQQWVYGDRTYFYFENGILRSWQN